MSQSSLRETIKDILLTVNTQMATEKADMWTNIILLAIEADKKKEPAIYFGDPAHTVTYTSKVPEEDLTGASL